MCDPVTIGTVATVASGTLTAYGQYEQGRQAAAAANVNARQFENQAQRTRNAATEKENDHRRMVAEMVSRQRAQFGAAGVDLGSGSPLDITLDTQELGNIDALRIRKTADDEVQSLKDQAKFTKDILRAVRNADIETSDAAEMRKD